MKIQVLDTTLRDGEQGGRVHFSIDDKLAVVQRLDQFGIDYVEGGWPASSPKDAEFFRRAARLELKHARLVVFGGVRHRNHPVESDPQVTALLAADTRVVSIFADGREMVKDARALDRAAETVSYLYARGREVIFDAAYFFDLFGESEETALRLLEAVHEAGAAVACLCDTRGGTHTARVGRICGEVRKRFPGVLGIHAHNDMGLALANTLAAVQEGFTHVQGSVNGYGDGCGIADLCAVIANLELKLGHETVGRDRVPELAQLARFVAAAAGVPMRGDEPWVGRRARTPWQEPKPFLTELFREGAAPDPAPFRVLGMEVNTRTSGYGQTQTRATVNLEVEGAAVTASAEGDGPVHALDSALRECLAPLWPEVTELRLVNYTVHVLEPQRGSAARAQVIIEWKSPTAGFTTTGVSENLINASWMALLDAAQVVILQAPETEPAMSGPAGDQSWAV